MSDFRLKAFCSVARHLSFTKAAQELFISQPAVTKHIQELETLYQTRLFERRGSHIVLTVSGHLLLEHCERILDEYKKLEYGMNMLKGEYTGELRLGASTTIAQYVLPPLLPRFIEQSPQISLSLLNGNSGDIEDALLEHRIDLGMVEGAVRLPTLKYQPFLWDELVAVVSADNKLVKTDELTVADLVSIPFVLREHGSGTLDVFKKALEKQGIRFSELQVKMYLGTTEGIKLFLENSDCMGILSIRSIFRELVAGRLKVIEIEDLSLTRELSFVHLQGQEGGLPHLFMQFISMNERFFKI